MTGTAIGRMVHYVARGSADGRFPKACRAADITEVAPGENPEGYVGLMVKNPTGLFFHPLEMGGVRYDGSEDPEGGTWHWPERV